MMKRIRDCKGYCSAAGFDNETKRFVEMREPHPFLAQAEQAAQDTTALRPVPAASIRISASPAPRSKRRRPAEAKADPPSKTRDPSREAPFSL